MVEPCAAVPKAADVVDEHGRDDLPRLLAPEA